jgi:hypothetical protein
MSGNGALLNVSSDDVFFVLFCVAVVCLVVGSLCASVLAFLAA